MGKEIKPLKCSVQACGLPFIVTDTLKDTTFQPGTQGVLSYVMGPDYNNPNIVFQQVVTTRRGKTGKARMNINMILSPMFEVPGVEFEEMFPKTDDRKHFIEIDVDNQLSAPVMGVDDPVDNNFLSWLFARCLFVRELDKAVYPPDHQIMKTLEMGGGKSVYIWPKDKLDVLKQFTGNIERWYNDGATDSIAEVYSNNTVKPQMLNQLRAIESALIIPRLEYQRKVNGIMIEALNYISKHINNKAKKVENRTEINRSLKKTRQIVKAGRSALDATIKNRLSVISKNRKLLNF